MTDEKRKSLADAFNREIDPLAKYTAKFEELNVDIFELFIRDILNPKDLSQSTIDGYQRVIREWCEFMSDQNRHPACPNEEHVKQFIRREIDEKDNSCRTAKSKLWKLNNIYSYWQGGAEFPHPNDYNPFINGKKKLPLSTSRVKDPPRMSVPKLQEELSHIHHLRDLAFIITQLKLGLRASEMANIKIRELSLSNSEVKAHYSVIGSSPHLDQFENAVYIPADREGNKSERPRVLPIDEELRRLWTNYLLIRPDNEEPWLFLSRTNHTKVDDEAINLAWKRYFHPKYEETQQHRAVTSHYGRHRFTTYWRVEQDLNRELIKYMRGDTSAGGVKNSTDGIDQYIHSYYEDIEPIYREQIYKLSV